MPLSKVSVTEVNACGGTVTSTGWRVGGPVSCERIVYVPGGSETRKRPSLAERVWTTTPGRTTSRFVASGRSGHGIPARSTGHVGPTRTVPSIPESGNCETAPCAPQPTSRIPRRGASNRAIMPVGRRFPKAGFPPSAGSAGVGLRLEEGDVRKVPEPFVEVEAVADDEVGGDREALVADVELDLVDARLLQQRDDLQARRLPGPEVLQQVVERQARVDDVLYDEDVAPLDLVVEVLEDPHDARGMGRRAVGGDVHEVEHQRQADAPGEIGHQHERALQDADEQELPPAVVLGD